jgi:D-sedoheptulose 7-phosphate isomerase
MDFIQQLISRYPLLAREQNNINEALSLLLNCFSVNGKLLIAGNGGSSADADHIVGELGKAFVRKRPCTPGFAEKLLALDAEQGAYLAARLEQGLPAIALHAHTALATATANDRGGDLVYAQQVMAFGAANDVFLGISTSGNANNVNYACITAKAKNMKTIALTGKTGGVLARLSDIAIIVPETETYKIQELHLPVYHALCLAIEERFFS